MIHRSADFHIPKTLALTMLTQATGFGSDRHVLRVFSSLGWTVCLTGDVYECWSPKPNFYKDQTGESRVWRGNCSTPEACWAVELLQELKDAFRMCSQKAA